jgi:hypothetical protein
MNNTGVWPNRTIYDRLYPNQIYKSEAQAKVHKIVFTALYDTESVTLLG